MYEVGGGGAWGFENTENEKKLEDEYRRERELRRNGKLVFNASGGAIGGGCGGRGSGGGGGGIFERKDA